MAYKKISKNEFRFSKKTKHPTYIFEEGNNRYRSVGITHSPKTFGKDNMPLSVNPKKGDSRQAFIRNGFVTGPKQDFGGSTMNNYQFSNSDFKLVKSKVRNYKRGRNKKSR